MIHKLEADGIQLQLGERMLLSGIYLKCETGKITGLLGRNGGGKTSLMNVIYGILKCEKSVRIDSLIQNEAYKRPYLLRYLPQFRFIPASLSLKRVFRDFELDFNPFAELYPEFASAYKSPVGSLSGGGHRLVELYLIVKAKTCFCLLDEPFTHLSPIQIEKVKNLLLEEKNNKGFLITDHLYKQVTGISDNIYFLSDGKTQLLQNIEEIETLGYVKN
jgi:ABC-type lipopolysaccharide export system ATPase subunit